MLSIITINYNNRLGLEKTFASVFCQLFSQFEYIVIDGGSTDGSLSCIKNHASRITHWISEKDNGIYGAMNKGILLAKGEYYIFLNSGDCFCSSDTLTHCMRYISASPEADILYADIYLVNMIRKNEKELYTHPSKLDLTYFLKKCPNHQASLIKANLFKEFDLYPAEYKLAGDYWLFLKSFLFDKHYSYMDFIMIDYDISGLSVTNGVEYIKETEVVWKRLVPIYVQQLLNENLELKKLIHFKLIRTAIFRRFKNRMKKMLQIS